MANTIILKRSATPAKVPTTGQLALGEIGINTYDGKIFIKKDDGTAAIVEVGAVKSVNGSTGTVVLTTDSVAEGSAQYHTTARARSAVSAGTGISYSSGTGVITTSQNIATGATPTFAGLTLTGNMGITGHIIPATNITYDLGSASYQWRDIYVGPGSLYVNGQKVLEDDSGTITFSADVDENIRIKTLGAGILQLGSSAQTGVIQIDSTLQITAGKNITDSAGIKVNFGDDIEMNGNKVIGLGAPSSANDAATKTYVDTAIGNISTSSITQGNSNVTVTDTGTGTVTVSVDGSTALTVSATGVTVAGNLTVSGATTTVESNTISLADNIITLNSDASGAASQNAGVEVERGDDTNVALRWNEGTDKWTFTNDGATYLPMAVSTTDLAEGTNLYYTDTRARTSLSGSSATGISYSSGTGAFSLGSIPNSSLTNTAVTIGSTSTALGATSTTLAGLTSVTSTGFTGALTGNASTATALATARTIAMSGDVTWTSLAFDGSGSVSSASTISALAVTNAMLAGSIANAKLSNSSVTVGSTAIALGATSTTLAGLTSVTSTTFVGALTGNASTATSATTAGTITSQANSATTTAASANTASTIVLRDASGNFTAGTITAALTGNVTGNVTGALTGNASTATSAAAWTTARTITLAGDLSGSVSIDGSANVTLTATVAGDTVALGTDTTGNYVAAGAVSGNGLSGSAGSEGATFTVTSNATNANTASTIVFRDASGNFSAGTITAALTGNVTGNVTGSSGSTTGNASTATALATARAIQGVSFNGSADITVVTAGTGISVSGTTVTNTITNNNQLTNGAGYVTSSGVTAVTGTAPVVSSGGTTPAISMAAATASVNGYMTSTYAAKLDGIAASATNVTNTNQLTNGAGYYSSGSTPSFGATSTGALSVTGAITATGEVTAYYSDANLKKDIVEITDPIAKVMSLRGVTFRPNATALALGITDKEEVGVIAQEVEAVLPQLVTPSAFAGYKTVKYDKLTALLLEAVKSQQLQIDALRAEISKLAGSATTEL